MIANTEVQTSFAASEIDKETSGMGAMFRDIDQSKYDFVPWTGRILVKRFDPDKETAGGLILPDHSLKEKSWGTVEKLPAVNPPEGLALGDIIVFVSTGGDNMSEAFGEGFVLLDYRNDYENDILGIFKPKKSA